MSLLEYLVWLVVGGLFAIVFGYIMVRAMTTAHYHSRTDYERRRAWEEREDRADKSSDCYK